MFEAYKVAVKISLVNHVTAGLLGLSSQFRKVHGDAEKLQSQLDKIKLTMLRGGALAATGAFGLGLIGKTIKPAMEYAHQLEQMNVAGMKHLEIVRATQAAWDANKSVPTSNVMENMAAIRHLRMVFGDTGHAIEYMPVIQRIQAVLQNTKGSGSKDESYELAKALEMKGAVRNPAEFNVQANLMTKAIIASGGKVGASDFLGTFKYGRSATSGWSDAFTYSILPTLIQEMKSAGGSSGGMGGPGNALMSAYAAVVGGTVPQKALKVWDQIGMLDKSKVVWTRDGHSKGLAPGGIMGSETFQSNPYEWAQKFLVPALQKAGYQTEAQQKQALQYLFPNRTSGFVMSQFVTQAWKFQRDQKLISEAKGLDAYDSLLKNDPMLAEIALQKQWQSLLAILGYQIMPPLLKGTLWLVDALRDLSHWVKENQGKAKLLMYAFTGLSTALLFGGTVTLLAAAFRGLNLAIGVVGGAGSGAGGVGLIGGLSRMAMGVTALGVAVTAFLAIAYLPDIIKWAHDHSGADKSKIPGTHHDSGSFPNPLLNPRFQNKTSPGLLTPYWNAFTDWATTPLVGSGGAKAPVIHNHFHVDGKEITTHMMGMPNLTGTPYLNPSANRPMPGTPAHGF